MKRLFILLATVLVAALPGTAFADAEDNGGIVLRVSGDYNLPAGEELDSLVVIDGSANVAGTVHNRFVVINGDAVVSGQVDGHITMIRSDLKLSGSAVVDDVRLIESDLDRAPGANVRGDVDEGWGAGGVAWAVLFGTLFFVGLGLAFMVVSTGFALVAGKQLTEAAESLTGRPWQTIVTGLVTAIALPIVGVVAIATVVGAWIGLGIWFALIPALVVLGLAVSATWLGLFILPGRPVAAAATGAAVLLVAFLIPWLGGITFVVFSIWGVGGLVHRVVRRFGGGLKTAAAASQPPTATPQPSA